MKKQLFILIILCLLSVNIALAMNYEVSDFPNFFIEDGKINTIIVIGSQAKASDVISAVDIAMKLQYFQDTMSIQRLGNIVYLDNEIRSIKEYNAIVVGGYCVNSAASEMLGYPLFDSNLISPAEGMIKLVHNEDFDTYNLLVAGYSQDDTRKASQVLVNHENYDLRGRTIRIRTMDLEDIVVE